MKFKRTTSYRIGRTIMETERLSIRKFVDDDLQGFLELIRDKQASKYAIYDDQFPTDAESLRNILCYFRDSEEFWAVELKAENKLIGFISLNYVDDATRNIGYCIHSKYQGYGYAKDAVQEAISYAKDVLAVNKLVSGTARENTASVELLKKTGFSITRESKASFASDENGNPIEFIAYSFERILK